MTAPTHVLSGLAVVVVVGRLFGVTPNALGLLSLIVGSLAPDIDGKGSITRPGKIFNVFLGFRLARFVDNIFQFIAKVIGFIFGHRGFIHAPLLGILFIAIGLFFHQTWIVWFGVGYLSHLLGDFFTPAGIPIWSPISFRKFSIGNIRVGSRHELILALGILVFVCVFGWSLLPEKVKDVHIILFEGFFA
jgi:inner membrane protein